MKSCMPMDKGTGICCWLIVKSEEEMYSCESHSKHARDVGIYTEVNTIIAWWTSPPWGCCPDILSVHSSSPAWITECLSSGACQCPANFLKLSIPHCVANHTNSGIYARILGKHGQAPEVQECSCCDWYWVGEPSEMVQESGQYWCVLYLFECKIPLMTCWWC